MDSLVHDSGDEDIECSILTIMGHHTLPNCIYCIQFIRLELFYDKLQSRSYLGMLSHMYSPDGAEDRIDIWVSLILSPQQENILCFTKKDNTI